MSEYRKKSVVIEAIQWTGDKDPVTEFLGEENRNISWSCSSKVLSIGTLEGTMKAPIGWWIIKGVQGEFYPCKPDIFEATYSEAFPSEPAETGVSPCCQQAVAEALDKVKAALQEEAFKDGYWKMIPRDTIIEIIDQVKESE